MDQDRSLCERQKYATSTRCPGNIFPVFSPEGKVSYDCARRFSAVLPTALFCRVFTKGRAETRACKPKHTEPLFSLAPATGSAARALVLEGPRKQLPSSVLPGWRDEHLWIFTALRTVDSLEPQHDATCGCIPRIRMCFNAFFFFIYCTDSAKKNKLRCLNAFNVFVNR